MKIQYTQIKRLAVFFQDFLFSNFFLTQGNSHAMYHFPDRRFPYNPFLNCHLTRLYCTECAHAGNAEDNTCGLYVFGWHNIYLWGIEYSKILLIGCRNPIMLHNCHLSDRCPSAALENSIAMYSISKSPCALRWLTRCKPLDSSYGSNHNLCNSCHVPSVESENAYQDRHGDCDILQEGIQRLANMKNQSSFTMIPNSSHNFLWVRLSLPIALTLELIFIVGVTNGLLKPLLTWAEEVVPVSRHKTTPVFLCATAGLRNLLEEQQLQLLGIIRSTLHSSPFRYFKTEF